MYIGSYYWDMELAPSSMCGFYFVFRCQHSVKHFRVEVKKNRIEFGQEIFQDVDTFIQHFENCPLIGDDAGEAEYLEPPASTVCPRNSIVHKIYRMIRSRLRVFKLYMRQNI